MKTHPAVFLGLLTFATAYFCLRHKSPEPERVVATTGRLNASRATVTIDTPSENATINSRSPFYPISSSSSLDRLSKKSGETRILVEAMLWNAEDDLRSRGLIENKESILESIVAIYPGLPLELGECVAMYVFLRIKGTSDFETREQMKAMFRGLGLK
jgi:hypothetical protein